MAKVKKNNRKKIFSGAIVAVLLVGGVLVTTVATNQNTEQKSHASVFNDLNTSFAITQTNNPDGTMGPVDYTGNFSTTLPESYLGSLNFQVTDPPQRKRENDKNDNQQISLMPSEHVLPTQAEGQADNKENINGNSPTVSEKQDQGIPNSSKNTSQGGPQSVSSLVVTINKVEVHIAHIGLPGEKHETEKVTPTNLPNTPSTKSNQDVDKWEVLNIGGVKTLDLVSLAKTKSLASIGITKLVNGRYTEIRLYIKNASATLQDGTKVPLIIPGRANIVRIVQPFVIDSSKTTILTIDFDAQNSVVKAGSDYLLKPVVAHLLENHE